MCLRSMIMDHVIKERAQHNDTYLSKLVADLFLLFQLINIKVFID